MATSATVHYVGQKVSKVRWRPSTHLKRSKVFASGGWDNNVSQAVFSRLVSLKCSYTSQFMLIFIFIHFCTFAHRPKCLNCKQQIVCKKQCFNIYNVQQQVNNLCLWSTEDVQGDRNAMSLDSNLPDEPQLICTVEHEGSVTDIKVSKAI